MLGFVRWSEMLATVGLAQKPPAVADERPKPTAAERPGPPVVRLGLEKSQAATLTWVGFEQATEHQAEQSVTEQSAFTTSPPSPSSAPALRPAPPPPAPAVLATPSPRPEPDPSPAEAERRLAEQIRSLSGQLADAQRALERRLSGLAEALPTARSAAATGAPERESQPSPQQPQTQPTAAPQTGLPGTESDKESIATSVKKAPTVRPGQVMAGQGLEIKTRVPRWTTTTMLTHQPRNPTVRIVFGRDGAVRQAEFVRDGAIIYNTGSEDVDQPLLNAIYGWTAKGQAIRDLKPEDPGVSILITIILSG
jgi:hypothetical protein